MKTIETSFSKAASTYEAAACVQDATAKHLSHLIQKYVEPQTHILELGAGTGFLTRQLLQLFNTTSITAVDVSPSMLSELQKRLSPSDQKRVLTLQRDMDTIETKERYSLITSSFSLHWSRDPLKLLQHSSRLLKSNGYIAHALPIKGSLRSLISNGYLYPMPQLMLSIESLRKAVASLEILEVSTHDVVQPFDSPLQALFHIKAFGGSLGPPLNRSLVSLRHTREPLSCEWCIGFVLARRKK